MSHCGSTKSGVCIGVAIVIGHDFQSILVPGLLWIVVGLVYFDASLVLTMDLLVSEVATFTVCDSVSSSFLFGWHKSAGHSSPVMWLCLIGHSLSLARCHPLDPLAAVPLLRSLHSRLVV
jgi:hypothetical protein